MLIASVKQIILSADLTSDLQQGHSLVWGGKPLNYLIESLVNLACTSSDTDNGMHTCFSFAKYVVALITQVKCGLWTALCGLWTGLWPMDWTVA